MKKLYFLLALLPFTAVSFGQTDSLETEILNYSSSKSDIISKARRLLLDSFMADDLDKVEEVKDYLLKEVEDANYVALFPAEHWLILYWTEEYDELLLSLQEFDRDIYTGMEHKILPSQDVMYESLQGKSLVWEEKLEWKLRNSALSEEEKDFLRLNLAWMLDDGSQPEALEGLNQRADIFLESYPGSTYENFVRQELRYKYVPSDWGLGMEFFTGYGMFSGELADWFSNTGAFGMGIDGEYDKLTLSLRIAGWIGTTGKDISNEQGMLWKKGEAALTFIGEAALGYTVLETDRIKLSPFGGIGVTEISAPEDDLNTNPDLEHLIVGPDVTYSLGATLDYKLGLETGELVENKKTYWFLRLRYAYVMPQFLGNPGGNLHTLSLGFGAVFRNLKREL